MALAWKHLYRCSSRVAFPISSRAVLHSAKKSPSKGAPMSLVASEPPLSFTNNIANDFQGRTTWELLRALVVLRLCRSERLVQNAAWMLKKSYAILGTTVTNTLVKTSFFGHFCGGETAQEMQREIQTLHQAGIGAILDYAAENDVENPRDLNGIPQHLVIARTYDYEGEAECDRNAEVTLRSIEEASKRNGFSAIKLTALGKPELLRRMSAILVDAQRLFHVLDGPSLSTTKTKYLDKLIDFPTLKAGFQNAGNHMDEQEIGQLFQAMDLGGDGHIDYLDWLSFVNPMDLTMGPLTPYFEEGPLSNKEKLQLANMLQRLKLLAKAASERNVRLMVDAEQTYMQPAIDHLVLNLQRKYNKEKAVIFNTFQCYLKDSELRIRIDLERAKREGFYFACKLVRGAYMIQERKRAKDLGYPDPIHDNIEATHANFNAMVDLLLENNKICEFMVASHNERSVHYTIQRMAALHLPKSGSGVYFGQLLGMCDPVSFTLGHHGYEVFKYVPYGPVQEVIPYLIRRAEENSGLMDGVSKETRLLAKELRRRLLPSFFSSSS
ncbi:hypothetical protein ACA910_011726 [Epithemia clementina (nom. ined.)]